MIVTNLKNDFGVVAHSTIAKVTNMGDTEIEIVGQGVEACVRYSEKVFGTKFVVL